MSTLRRQLVTRHGTVTFPAYVPVTTFGHSHPLDELVRPYLPRLARAVMVSYHYAKNLEANPMRLPIYVDSGGFALLFQGSRLVEHRGLGAIEIDRDGEMERISPAAVLDLQERVADVAFTLDFPIPPGLDVSEAARRQHFTIANAEWALANRRRRDLPLFASIQAWDQASARACAGQLASRPFDGFAIGGLVPRARDRKLLVSIVKAVRAEVGDRPVHVFGLGDPDLVRELFEVGVDSVDSSSYVRLAADGRLWGKEELRLTDPSATDRLHLALCNLALASSKTLPLAFSRLVFSTFERCRELDSPRVSEAIGRYQVVRSGELWPASCSCDAA